MIKKIFVLMMFAVSPIESRAQLESNLSVNVKDSPVRGVLEMIAAHAGLELVLKDDPNVNVTIAQSGVSAKKLLDKISMDQQIEYAITGSQLIVTKRGIGKTIAGTGDSYQLKIKYANANDIFSKLSPIIGQEERLILDEPNNALIFIGSKPTYLKLTGLIGLFDTNPKQIMIEAQIVETSSQFMYDMGFSMGDLSDTTLNSASGFSGYATTSQPSVPNLAVKAVIGKMGGRNLDLRLAAAEQNGDAKVISRPKVVTLNNRKANINSGISFTVRALNSLAGSNSAINGVNAGVLGAGTSGLGGGVGLGVVGGGVTQIHAGLTLNILPTIVGDDQVRMVVDINNSQPDAAGSVDGIPGILNNAASTAVIVKSGQTAVIAGLVKQSKSENSTSVPILSSIPLIGGLFQSTSKKDKNNELVIFITPTIDGGKVRIMEEPPAQAAAPQKTEPEQL
jgi:type IV pilus assembly protein PilQ